MTKKLPPLRIGDLCTLNSKYYNGNMNFVYVEIEDLYAFLSSETFNRLFEPREKKDYHNYPYKAEVIVNLLDININEIALNYLNENNPKEMHPSSRSFSRSLCIKKDNKDEVFVVAFITLPPKNNIEKRHVLSMALVSLKDFDIKIYKTQEDVREEYIIYDCEVEELEIN